MNKLVVLMALTAFLGTSAWAASQTVTLSVSGMTCAACPITVKKALIKVDGVHQSRSELRETRSQSQLRRYQGQCSDADQGD